MTKIEVIRQKPSENWILGKNGHFLTVFGQKNLRFWIFPRVQLLTHARRHSGEDLRKISAKNNDKNWSYWPKTAEISSNGQKSDKMKAKNSQILNFPGGTGTNTH